MLDGRSEEEDESSDCDVMSDEREKRRMGSALL